MTLEGLAPVLQQTLAGFTAVPDSSNVMEVKDSIGVATRLQDIFDSAKADHKLDDGSTEDNASKQLCEALRSKRFVFLYDSKKVRFGHIFWRFISRPFCKYVDVNEIPQYERLLTLIQETATSKTRASSVPGAFPGENTQALRKRIQELEASIETLRGQNGQLEQETQGLRDQLEAEKRESRTLKENNATLTQEVALLKEGNRKLEASIAQLGVENEKLKSVAPRVEQPKAPARAEGARAKESQTKEAQIKALQAQLEEIQKESNALEAQNRASSEERDRLTKQLAQAQADLARVKLDRNLLSMTQAESLRVSLEAACPPIRGGLWSSEKKRFILTKQDSPPPPDSDSFLLFFESLDAKTGRTSVSYNDGQGLRGWDPLVETIPTLVERAREAPGILWVKMKTEK